MGAGAECNDGVARQIDHLQHRPVVSCCQMPGRHRDHCRHALKDTQDISSAATCRPVMARATAFIDFNPNTTQALANAMVRAEQGGFGGGRIAVMSRAGNLAPGHLQDTPSRKAWRPVARQLPEDGAATALKALAAYQAGNAIEGLDQRFLLAAPTRMRQWLKPHYRWKISVCTFVSLTTGHQHLHRRQRHNQPIAPGEF